MKLKEGHWLLIIGALLFLFTFQATEYARSDKPVYDGIQNHFDVDIVSHKSLALEGEDYWITARVENAESSSGRMFVQCSILDRHVEPWISRTSYVRLTEDDNCVANEPFTQTVIVTLAGGAAEVIRFNIEVPDAGTDDVIYCGAFERCYSSGVDSLQSGSDYISINVVERSSSSSSTTSTTTTTEDDEEADDTTTTTTTTSTTRQVCDNTRDCKGWLFGGVECVSNRCVDKDLVKVPDVSDASIKGWAGDHKAILFFVGLVLLIIGAVLVYYEPKKPYVGF